MNVAKLVTGLSAWQADGLACVACGAGYLRVRVYGQGTIPAATYGQPADMPTVMVPNLLLVREGFPVGNACGITKLIFDQKAELASVHPSAKEITREIASRTDPVPRTPAPARPSADGRRGAGVS
ncbi:TAXI family TRAP transporter solute-binding subunit [Amycolatopsis taiwanensis]|uniref:Uncharacterized protein n=1 Tax=Amycolatopsis taiwanensis TaxID=342230 RepID=A0A9W6R2A9_9PSEU|nr:TAXI family TRAP transporter solute-binding subunit [Amycolatopsis taiwanensis]GLY67983.1 hypothetical protein Atai01_46020 [Amycolatopsis taiwanensis]